MHFLLVAPLLLSATFSMYAGHCFSKAGPVEAPPQRVQPVVIKQQETIENELVAQKDEQALYDHLIKIIGREAIFKLLPPYIRDDNRIYERRFFQRAALFYMCSKG